MKHESLNARPTKQQLILNVVDSLNTKEFKANLSVLEAHLNGMTDKQQMDLKLKLNTAVEAQKKLKNLKMTPQMNIALLNLMSSGLTDEISDQEARRNVGIDVVPLTQEQLPAIINKDLRASGISDPAWTQVKHLPGYLSSSIRQIGRQIFKPFTDVPIEDVQVLAYFNSGGSPNTNLELNSVAGWLKNNGERITDSEIKFEQVMPGYEAQIRVYKASGYEFMVVKDFAGQYIYSYIAKDSSKKLGLSKR